MSIGNIPGVLSRQILVGIIIFSREIWAQQQTEAQAMGVARGGRAHRVERVRRDVRGGAAGGEDRAGAHTDAAAADGDARPGATWSAADGEDRAGAGGDGGDGAAGAHASVRASGDRVGAGGLREDRDGPGGARGVHADAHGDAAPGVAAAPGCPHLAYAVHRSAGGRDESAAQRRLHASGPRPPHEIGNGARQTLGLEGVDR